MSAKIQQQINDAVYNLSQGNSDAAWHILTRISFPPMTDSELALASQEVLRVCNTLLLGDDIKPLKDLISRIAAGTYA